MVGKYYISLVLMIHFQTDNFYLLIYALFAIFYLLK